jgi:hypothetical protein
MKNSKYEALDSRSNDQNYNKIIMIQSSCDKIYQALTTQSGLAGWWTPLVKGSCSEGEILHFEFEGLNEYIDMRIDTLRFSELVEWTCLTHTSLPEWSNTKIRFQLTDKSKSSCELHFQHQGLIPSLQCFEDCKKGWDYFLASIVSYCETDRGTPFGNL